ncbi:hypothetical protein K0C01_02480 [Salinarchaeum sp. IM2453]|nr:hypothetical protein [Salinarchaeum sp. IM2453]QZA89049.1 hypothetical protein K0C01_02480 [Salinarchaeum sp. IM2453]
MISELVNYSHPARADADRIVSGDKDLREVGSYNAIEIIIATELQR